MHPQKKSKLKALFKIIIVLTIVYVGFHIIDSKVIHRGSKGFSMAEMNAFAISVDHTEEHKNTDSDIEGMTV